MTHIEPDELTELRERLEHAEQLTDELARQLDIGRRNASLLDALRFAQADIAHRALAGAVTHSSLLAALSAYGLTLTQQTIVESFEPGGVTLATTLSHIEGGELVSVFPLNVGAFDTIHDARTQQVGLLLGVASFAPPPTASFTADVAAAVAEETHRVESRSQQARAHQHYARRRAQLRDRIADALPGTSLTTARAFASAVIGRDLATFSDATNGDVDAIEDAIAQITAGRLTVSFDGTGAVAELRLDGVAVFTQQPTEQPS